MTNFGPLNGMALGLALAAFIVNINQRMDINDLRDRVAVLEKQLPAEEPKP